MIIYLCRFYFLKLKKVPPKVHKNDIIVFTYTNRYMEDININSLCNDKEINALYPIPSTKLLASYSYTQTIRSKVLNYTQTLLHENDQPNACTCSSNPFKDPAIGHVVTGNLGIIKNRKLRNLLKGVSFRECSKFNKDDLRNSISTDIDNHNSSFFSYLLNQFLIESIN